MEREEVKQAGEPVCHCGKTWKQHIPKRYGEYTLGYCNSYGFGVFSPAAVPVKHATPEDIAAQRESAYRHGSMRGERQAVPVKQEPPQPEPEEKI